MRTPYATAQHLPPLRTGGHLFAGPRATPASPVRLPVLPPGAGDRPVSPQGASCTSLPAIAAAADANASLSSTLSAVTIAPRDPAVSSAAHGPLPPAAPGHSSLGPTLQLGPTLREARLACLHCFEAHSAAVVPRVVNWLLRHGTLAEDHTTTTGESSTGDRRAEPVAESAVPKLLSPVRSGLATHDGPLVNG